MRGMKHLFAALLFVVLGAASIASSQKSANHALALPLRLTGAAVSGGGIGNPTGTARVDIVVKRLSTDRERQGLLDKLKTGQKALLDELQHAKPVGTIQFGTELAYDLHYARHTRGEDGGDRLVLATDRPVSAWEVWNQPRYADYPFTLIDVQVDGAKAKGTMILAAQITADKDGRFIHVENYGTQPIQLNNLEVSRDR
jgi:hypothetical protein